MKRNRNPRTRPTVWKISSTRQPPQNNMTMMMFYLLRRRRRFLQSVFFSFGFFLVYFSFSFYRFFDSLGYEQRKTYTAMDKFVMDGLLRHNNFLWPQTIFCSAAICSKMDCALKIRNFLFHDLSVCMVFGRWSEFPICVCVKFSVLFYRIWLLSKSKKTFDVREHFFFSMW